MTEGAPCRASQAQAQSHRAKLAAPPVRSSQQQKQTRTIHVVSMTRAPLALGLTDT